MGVKEWLVDQLFGDVVEARVREAVSFADEDRGWRALAGPGARDLPYHTLAEQLADSAEAYRQNPLAYRIVELTTDYVLGRGLRLRSPDDKVAVGLEAPHRRPARFHGLPGSTPRASQPVGLRQMP